MHFIVGFVLFHVFYLTLTFSHETTETLSDEVEALLRAEGEKNCPNLYGNKHAVCNIFPEAIEGPFYLPNQLVRKDVREGKCGVPLQISIKLADVSNCKPLSNIPVDIWSADATGEYSSFEGVKLTDPIEPSSNTTYLRGVQISDKNGKVNFITIFPGWYETRTVHIHLSIHLRDGKHTVQIYFDENVTSIIAQKSPYNSNDGVRVQNSEDFFYNRGAEVKLIKNSKGLKAKVLMAIRLKKPKVEMYWK